VIGYALGVGTNTGMLVRHLFMAGAPFALPRREANMTPDNRNDLGRILKQRRVMIPLTLQELAAASGVSASHIGRIERGNRFPSASTLQKIAKPLGFSEAELFTVAGYLGPQPSPITDESRKVGGQLDLYVAAVLSQEPVEIQRTVIAILSIFKSMAKGEG